MIIVFRKDATKQDIEYVANKIKSLGLKPMISEGVERTILGVIGPEDLVRVMPLEAFPGVEKVMQVLAPYKLVSREFKKEDTIIKIRDGIEIGGNKVVVIAGPCSIESKEQLKDIAIKIKEAGATILRGGAFKPRTSPYTFQGLGKKGLEILKEVSPMRLVCQLLLRLWIQEMLSWFPSMLIFYR